MNSNIFPPRLGQQQPLYPPLLQLLRVTGATVSGPSGGGSAIPGQGIVPPALMYVAETQQLRTDTQAPRDREPCLVTDPNGTSLAAGYYLGRLAGSYQSLPVYEVVGQMAVECCDQFVRIVNTTTGSGISSGSRTVTPTSMLGIVNGALLTIISGTYPSLVTESVSVSSVTSTTFTATFANAHAGPVTIIGALNNGYYPGVLATWNSASPGMVDGGNVLVGTPNGEVPNPGIYYLANASTPVGSTAVYITQEIDEPFDVPPSDGDIFFNVGGGVTSPNGVMFTDDPYLKWDYSNHALKILGDMHVVGLAGGPTITANIGGNGGIGEIADFGTINQTSLVPITITLGDSAYDAITTSGPCNLGDNASSANLSLYHNGVGVAQFTNADSTSVAIQSSHGGGGGWGIIMDLTGGGINLIGTGAAYFINGGAGQTGTSAGLSFSGGLYTGGTVSVSAAEGGTGQTSLTANAVMLGEGTSPVGSAVPVMVGYVLTDNGPGNDPSFQAPTGGGGSGTVTSVDVSGGSTGLTTSGGPITTSGVITIGGTLVANNGGTGGDSSSQTGYAYVTSGVWSYVSGPTVLTAGDSVTIISSVITLINDTASPVANTYYGANGSAILGWYSFPGATIGLPVNGGTAGAILFGDGSGNLAQTGNFAWNTSTGGIYITQSSGAAFDLNSGLFTLDSSGNITTVGTIKYNASTGGSPPADIASALNAIWTTLNGIFSPPW